MLPIQHVFMLISTLTSCVNSLSLPQVLTSLDGSFNENIVSRGPCDLLIIDDYPLPNHYGANRGIYASTESNLPNFGTVFYKTHCLIMVAAGNHIDNENLLTIGKDIQMKNPVSLFLRNIGKSKIKELRKLDVSFPVLIMPSNENGKHVYIVKNPSIFGHPVSTIRTQSLIQHEYSRKWCFTLPINFKKTPNIAYPGTKCQRQKLSVWP